MDKAVVGHEDLKIFFNNEIKKNIGGRCYLFEGIKGAGKRTFAEHFALNLLKINPVDFSIYFPTGKSYTHPIETLKTIKEEAMRVPHGSYLVIVIDEAEKMALNSSQSLLKIFEEPPATTIFILITDNRHKLLPTILSRCQIVSFKPLKDAEILKELPNCSESVLRLANGSFGKAKEFCEKGIPEFIEKTQNLLEKGKISTYFSLQEAIEPIAEQLETEENRQLFFSTILYYFRKKQLEDLEKEIPFQRLSKAIKNAKFSLDRFTAPKQALETLFLEIYLYD